MWGPPTVPPPKKEETMKSNAELETEILRGSAKENTNPLAGTMNYHHERELAEIRTLKARATMNQAASWLMCWVLFWFAIAIAAAGIKTAQYVWWMWTPSFLP